jgi:hypothetical protein
MHGAVWPCVGGAVLALLGACLFLTVYVDSATSIQRSPLMALAVALGMLLQLAALLAFAIGNVLFLICLRGIAVFFQKPRLAQHLLIFLIAVPIVLLLFGLGAVLATVILRSALRDSDAFSVIWGLLWNGVRLTIHLAMAAWGFLLVQQLRGTMDRAAEGGSVETA